MLQQQAQRQATEVVVGSARLEDNWTLVLVFAKIFTKKTLDPIEDMGALVAKGCIKMAQTALTIVHPRDQRWTVR